jgi:hypothetical protein
MRDGRKLSEGATKAIKSATKLVEQAQVELLKAIKQSAKETVRRFPMVQEYVHAMGQCFFVLHVNGVIFEPHAQSSREEVVGNITKHFEEGELDQSTKTELAQVAGAINEMAGLITAWNDLFNGVAGGDPFRVGKNGRILTDW